MSLRTWHARLRTWLAQRGQRRVLAQLAALVAAVALLALAAPALVPEAPLTPGSVARLRPKPRTWAAWWRGEALALVAVEARTPFHPRTAPPPARSTLPLHAVYKRDRTVVAPWQVVWPPAAVGSGPLRLEVLCSDTGGWPDTPSGAIALGRRFQGEVSEWGRLRATGACLLGLAHPAWLAADGQPWPLLSLPLALGANFTVLPPPQWTATGAALAALRASPAQHMSSFAVAHRALLLRGHSHAVVLRDAVLWPEGLALSARDSLGGAGCREWAVAKAVYGAVEGLQLPQGGEQEAHADPAALRAAAVVQVAIWLHARWSAGYYHWLVEALPRLWLARQLLQRLPGAQALVAPLSAPWHGQSIALLGVPRAAVRAVPSAPVRARWAVLPSGSGCNLAPLAYSELGSMGAYMVASAALVGTALPAGADAGRAVHPTAGAAKVQPPPSPQAYVWPNDTAPQLSGAVREEATLGPAVARDLLPQLRLSDAQLWSDSPRTAALRALDASAELAPRGVVVVVKRTARRWLANHGDVVAWVAAALPDAAVVEFEGGSVAEQAVLFRNAALVVAPHGAGLSNLIFARPGTGVVEILPHTTPAPAVYARLATGLGHPYFVTRADSGDAAMTVARETLLRLLLPAWHGSWWRRAAARGAAATAA